MAPHDDADLWRKASKGNHEAFAEIFDRHAPALYRFSSKLLGPSPAAEDAVHDVLLSVLKGSSFNPSRGSLRAYLLGAVRNQAHNRRPNLFAALPESAVSPEMPQDVRMARAQVGQTVAAAIDALPWGEREVLLLFHYEELSLNDVAQALSLSLAAVKSRLHRARETLRVSLKDLSTAARKGEQK